MTVENDSDFVNAIWERLHRDNVEHKEEDNRIENTITFRSGLPPTPDGLTVEVIHFYPRENAQNHKTDLYELVQVNPQSTVLRRGQSFYVVVRLKETNNATTAGDRSSSRPFDPRKDSMKLLFNFGINPSPVQKTQGILPVMGNQQFTRDDDLWDIRVHAMRKHTVTLEVRIPPDAPVGLWTCQVETGIIGSAHVPSLYKEPSNIFILFNPWSKHDAVYMDDTRLLEEYVLSDVGKIWVGPFGTSRGRQWVFGQFDDSVLPAAIYLLERSNLSHAARGNPIKVTRALSKMVNSNDDNGVIEGRWDGEYKDGTAPAAWSGSVKILEQYLSERKPVKYGQCWVFAGVVTTICRALGIPSRVVSNLVSAHDANQSMTVDRYFDKENDELEWDPHNPHGKDSIWNFHVWSDVWMARPDLPKGYGGWQAIDSTPQETSEGFFQCGPASVEAVRQGQVGLGYDVPFVVAEVNADIIRWLRDDSSDLGFAKMDTNKYHVGRQLLTKLPYVFDPNGDRDREDITPQYKSREGTEAERLTLYNAVRGTDLGRRFFMLPSKSASDVNFDLEDLERVPIGDSFSVTVNIYNGSNSTRTIKAVLSAGSVYYTGVKAHHVKRASGTFQLKPSTSEQLQLVVRSEEYMERLVEYCIMKIDAIATVEETKQTWADEDDFQVIKPKLEILVKEPVRIGEPTKVSFSFRNPLKKTLTRCQFTYEGPGLSKSKVVDYRDVGPLADVSMTHNFIPRKVGEYSLVGTFSSRELVDIIGSTSVTVVNREE